MHFGLKREEEGGGDGDEKGMEKECWGNQSFVIG